MLTFSKMRLAFLCLLILFFLMGSQVAFSYETDSKAAILIDQKTGKVLYEKNAGQKMPIASTTKIMTAIIAIEMASLREEISISEHVAGIGEASIDLFPGEKITLLNLLLGTLLASGNDAAVGIAELVAGSEQEFVQLMNKKALLLRAVNSNFINPNGLPAIGHYSTAYDLAFIARYALNNATFKEIVRIRTATIPDGDEKGIRYLKNTNKLLWHYAKATGIKTGTTDAAGPCLVASAEAGETRLIAVVLNSNERFAESKELLEWGFANFETVACYESGQHFATLPILNGQPETLEINIEDKLVFTKKREQTVIEQVNWQDIILPIMKGEVVGEIIIMVGEEKHKINLIAANDIFEKSLLGKLATKREKK